MYVGADGKLVFRTRYYWAEDTRSKTVQATFSDDGADQAYMSYQWRQGYDVNRPAFLRDHLGAWLGQGPAGDQGHPAGGAVGSRPVGTLSRGRQAGR